MGCCYWYSHGWLMRVDGIDNAAFETQGRMLKLKEP
jgi:hypothetical protein